jgi:hypothetical protein
MDQVMSSAFIKHLDEIERIDRLITAAESRRHAALRDLERHRLMFAQSLREAVVDAEFETVPPSPARPKRKEKAA